MKVILIGPHPASLFFKMRQNRAEAADRAAANSRPHGPSLFEQLAAAGAVGVVRIGSDPALPEDDMPPGGKAH